MLNRTQQPPLNKVGMADIPLPEKRTLANGILLNLFNTTDEEVLRLDIQIDGGGLWFQSQPLQALFVNRMLQQGTSRYDSKRIAERLDYYGGWLDVSTSTKQAYVTLYSLSKYFPQLLELLRSMLTEPVFPEKELAVAIERDRQQFKVNSKKVDVQVRKAFRGALFGPDYPCTKYAELEDYDRLLREALVMFHRHFYHSGNCTLYLSGKVTPEVIRQVEQAFGNDSWGDTSSVRHDYACKPVTTERKRIAVTCEQAVQSAVNMGFIAVDAKHPDFQKLRVLTSVFGGYFGSRLMKNIREDKGYTYGIGAGLQVFPDSSLFFVNTQTANECVEPLIREVYAEMDRLCNETVPEAELTMVKNYVTGELCRAYEGPFSLADAYIYIDSQSLPESFLADTAHALRDVTAQGLQEVARRYFVPENVVEAVAGPLK